jgi:hypothetical protein
VNVGNGVNFFQVGQFDQTGTSFDGPVNNNDGIDFLDGQEIYFNVAGAVTTNTPPLLISSAICDTIDVYTGDTLQKSLNSVGFSIGILTPEVQQAISISVDSDAPSGAFTHIISNVGNQFYNIDANFDATGVSPGIYHVTLTATDDGLPVGVTTKQFVFNVKYEASLGLTKLDENDFMIYPNPSSDKINIVLNSLNVSNLLQLKDLTGKTIFEKQIDSDLQLDLTNLNEGIYLVHILSNNELLGIKRVVKK